MDHRILSVVGPWGSGKTSLIRKLCFDDWPIDHKHTMKWDVDNFDVTHNYRISFYDIPHPPRALQEQRDVIFEHSDGIIVLVDSQSAWDAKEFVDVIPNYLQHIVIVNIQNPQRNYNPEKGELVLDIKSLSHEELLDAIIEAFSFPAQPGPMLNPCLTQAQKVDFISWLIEITVCSDNGMSYLDSFDLQEESKDKLQRMSVADKLEHLNLKIDKEKILKMRYWSGYLFDLKRIWISFTNYTRAVDMFKFVNSCPDITLNSAQKTKFRDWLHEMCICDQIKFLREILVRMHSCNYDLKTLKAKTSIERVRLLVAAVNRSHGWQDLLIALTKSNSLYIRDELMKLFQ
jgi:signal recognition particle receptor subunit beta